jgi:hypothetical protein
MTTHLAPKPSYCVGRTPLSKQLNLSQVSTCLKYRWNDPTAAARLGHDLGHSVLPALIVFAIIFVAVRALVRRSGGRDLRCTVGKI